MVFHHTLLQIIRINMVSKKLVLVSTVIAFIAWRYVTGQKQAAKITSPIIDTGNGQLRGIVAVSRDGQEVHEYLGIPYAKAERFEGPKPADSWSGVRDVDEFGAKCAQMGMLIGNIDGEEDCLFLNVFVPKVKPSSTLPVMVFIHGGHFTEGASNSYRPDFFMDEQVVFVTINYRLGALGFLNTEDGLVRGNMGLKDQTMALKWIQTNIGAFGGDSKQVTIIGESAGAASVHYHLLSPLSRGLFSKAIGMSGLATMPWAFMDHPWEQAVVYAKRLKCPTSNSKEAVACLKKKSAYELVAAHSNVLDFPRLPISIFVPTVERVVDAGTFLSKHPIDVLKSGNFNKVSFLTGVNSDEGLIASSTIIAKVGALDQLDRDSDNILPMILYMKKDDVKMRAIRDQYFGPGKSINTIDVFDNYTMLIQDLHMFAHFESSVQVQSKLAKLFVYYYTYPTEFTLTPILLALKGRFPLLLELLSHLVWSTFTKDWLGIEPHRYGICHADELALFFNMDGLTNVQPAHKDYAFSKIMTKLWVQFVKDENTMEFMGHKWSPIKPGESSFKYLQLDTKSAGYVIPSFRERLKFWDQISAT